MSTGLVIPSKVYWISWGVLLTLTLIMLALDTAPLPRVAFVLLMLGAMATKASIIGANFMHLRGERRALVAIIFFGLFATGALLFVLIAPDAMRIHEMLGQGR